MNVNATEDDLANIAEVLKLAGYLDDYAPKADKGRILAWAEQIHRHNLGRDDLLNGLQAYYDGPSDHAIRIGDLIHHARQARRTRTEAEEDAEREARQAAHDQHAEQDADTLRQLTATFIAGRVNDTPRLRNARQALDTCNGKNESRTAIAEYFEAKAAARATHTRPTDNTPPKP